MDVPILLLSLVLILWIASLSRAGGSSKSLINKQLIAAGVALKDIDKCLCWCFGEDYGSIPLHLWDERWCELHSDLFTVKGDDSVAETVFRFGKAWLAQVKTPVTTQNLGRIE